MQDPVERSICSKLVKKALAAGYAVSVYDGGAWPLKRSLSYRAIMAAMFSTDSDVLRFRAGDGQSLGTVLLIYGNGEDVISDHSDNAAMRDLVESTLD